ncbi:hypothetical protein SORBI_3004G114700 [Sorghum bicolor]|uniref:Embryo surrounding factor 1 brassicaceae domain-containing protein n=1 Tax=Sorghum bicolor TaxID=4558 RepID=A0A194YP01_SORBI|nr:hypothetical protein SORBI_3004G114700 [Sorghum bicolor]
MATRAASFALYYILLLTLCSTGAEVRGVAEYPAAASATPYCGRNFIASQGKCDDTKCWGSCHDKYFRLPNVTHVGGACETPTCCLCEVDCE